MSQLHDEYLQPVQPIFPPEIFQVIIDILAARPSVVTLTEEQKGTVKACALVCRLFLDLSRAHIFRLVEFGLTGNGEKRLDDLVSLLENRPGIKMCIQELSIQLDMYSWPTHSVEIAARRMKVLLDLPAVRSIAVYYSMGGPVRRLSEKDHIGTFCSDIIEAHAARGNLRTLRAKKMDNLPFETLFTSLTTLSLDRCQLPTFTKPIHTVKDLTLRKVDLVVSALSYFPDLEALRIIRTDILPCTNSDHLPAPFGIKNLSLEVCSEYGRSEGFGQSVSVFLEYFHKKAEHHRMKPFGHVTTLSVMLNNYSDMTIFTSLLKDVSGTLQTFSFGAIPPSSLDVSDLVKHLQNLGHSLSYYYESMQDLDLADNVNISAINLLPIITSFHPTFPINQVLSEHALFNPKKGSPEVSNKCEIMESWSDCVSSLSNICPTLTTFKEIELFAMVDDAPHLIKSEKDITVGMVNKMAESPCTMIGTRFDNSDAQSCRATLVFYIDSELQDTTQMLNNQVHAQ